MKHGLLSTKYSGYSYFMIKSRNYLDHLRYRGAIADSLGTKHLVVCCEIRQLTFEAGF